MVIYDSPDNSQQKIPMNGRDNYEESVDTEPLETGRGLLEKSAIPQSILKSKQTVDVRRINIADLDSDRSIHKRIYSKSTYPDKLD